MLARRTRVRRAAQRLQNARYDRLTIEVMHKTLREDSNCVDAGAHDGELLRHMVAFAPNGVHHAFEPLPALAATLRDRFPSVEVHESALADDAGRAAFRHVRSAPGNSGFERRPWDTYNEGTVEVIQVSVVRLDDVLPPGARVDFLKIDVEGSELRLLRGARNVLAANSPTIVIEVGLRAEEVYEELRLSGFAVFHLEDWLNGERPLSRPDFLRSIPDDWFFLACKHGLTQSASAPGGR